jgi:hypothetical protein
MAQPAYDPRQPLLDVLAASNLTIAEMNQMLKDGADEVDRLLPKLIEKHTTTGAVRAAQLVLVKRELKAMQSALWGDLGRAMRSGVGTAVDKAATVAEGVLWSYLAKHNVPMPQLREAQLATARAGIDAVLAKGANGIPLARSVYKTQALAQGLVDRKVSQGLLLGHDAKDIAKSVAGLIRPNVTGGVSYAAHRLARTEINNAYKTAQETRHADEPWVQGMRWNLSKSHPRRDICDDYAEADDDGLGEGVYRIGNRPSSHPNDMCYLTAESVDEDEFEEAFLRGEYNTYIDKTIYGAPGPVGGKPCA